MTSLIAETQVTAPASTKKAQEAKAGKIRSLYDAGVKDIREQTLQYAENACYIEGNQHVYKHKTRGELVQAPRNPRRVQATIPRLGPESRRLFSKLLKRPLVFEVTPDAPDDETIRGAAIAKGVIEDLWRTQKWERIREELCWSVWKGGTAALCLDWDATAGQYLGESPNGRPMGQGDVRVSALAINEIATEVGTRDIEKACWWIKAQAVPPAEAKKRYGLADLPAADASSAMSPVQTKMARAGSGETPKNLTLVLTYYERPSKEKRAGEVCTIIGNQVVDGPHAWPFPFKDRLNLVCARETIIEGKWTGRTVVTDAVPVQTALNHSWTSILEHLKQAGNARMQNNSAERTNAEKLTDEPGEFVFHDGDELWSWLSPPPMPDWWQRTPQELANQMDDIIGVHDISRGNAPTNIESGLGLSILAEQDDTPTGRLSQILADAWGDLTTMILETYEQNVLPDEQRLAKPNAPDAYIQEKFHWNGKSFAGQTTCHVPYDAVAPLNEAARFARGMALVDREIIKGGPQLSAFMDIPGSDFIARINPQVKKARDENYTMGQGEPEIPADFDNHATHIEEHNAQPLDAPVLTPSGWVKMGDLRIGDEVIAGDGFSTRVVDVIEFEEPRETYRFHFADSHCDVADQHLWKCQTELQRRKDNKDGVPNPHYGSWVVKGTQEIIDRWKLNPRPNCAIRVPMVEPIQFEFQPIHCDPYTLGAVLGDGHITKHGGIYMASADPEIIDRLDFVSSKQPSSKYAYWIGGMKAIVKHLGLNGKRAWEKSIPQAYLLNEPEVRLEVLRGLMDTDGTISTEGACSFSTTSEQLADDVRWIVWSLGGHAYLRVVEANSQNGPARQQYKVTINLPVNPFHLTRKAERWSLKPRPRILRRIEPLGKQKVRCIEVSHPDHLYVTEGFVVTHNCFRLSPRYRRMDDQTRMIVDQHVQAHENLAMEEMARQMFRMQNMPGMAIAAQGAQPPGSATPMSPNEPGAMPQDAVLGAQEGGNPEETVGGNPSPSPIEGEIPV